MALISDPSVYGAIWNSKFNRQSRIDYVGDKFINARRELGTKNVILGLRNGIPDNQDQDINFKRAQQLKPYVNGMNPYKTNLMVDIVPSVYNTNPIAGMGGYEANLASFNGTRPLATALDEPKELIERLYEDKFRLSPSHPLSAQYSMNQKRLDKTVRGTMYDAFRSRMNDNTTDEDLVMESKIMKGYGNNKEYNKTSNDRLTNEVIMYMKKQRPMNATDLMTHQQYTDLFNRHLDPATFRTMNAHLRNANDALDAANNTLNDLNITAFEHRTDFNNYKTDSLVSLSKQKSQMKNIVASMAGINTLLTTQVDNQLVMDGNRANDHQEMINAINNLNGRGSQAAPRGRSRQAIRRSSGVTDTAGGSPPPV
jgi:hypothetical protein